MTSENACLVGYVTGVLAMAGFLLLLLAGVPGFIVVTASFVTPMVLVAGLRYYLDKYGHNDR